VGAPRGMRRDLLIVFLVPHIGCAVVINHEIGLTLRPSMRGKLQMGSEDKPLRLLQEIPIENMAVCPKGGPILFKRPDGLGIKKRRIEIALHAVRLPTLQDQSSVQIDRGWVAVGFWQPRCNKDINAMLGNEGWCPTVVLDRDADPWSGEAEGIASVVR
jgi:hypothetical protein